ncbi:LysR family transcriptional regulator [Limosilactobacillus reuteri]|uniref:LysR family transcriptional regulator n=1 Tax=Limosilactobacillus reuteri TaxID=1598 RepID=UPI002B052D8E|nr:LysR family transcriptional regulator [Limosilactobacillus reuteri]
MRIQQLEYLEAVIETGSINEAAKRLYLTQPSLSSAIKDLEKEMGITILQRSNTGTSLTADGREFMNYAKQILDQVHLLDDRFKHQQPLHQSFAVSAQHYAFVVNAFVELIKKINSPTYKFTLRETETRNIFNDLRFFKSELGVLYINKFNRRIINKLLTENGLTFTPLFVAEPHVFLSRYNPLAKRKKLSLGDLTELPYLSFEQGNNNSFYFSEEIQSTLSHKKEIKVSDRATIFNLMVGLNGYTISSGIINSKLNDDKIVAIPLELDDPITIGIVRHQHTVISQLGQEYIELLKNHIRNYGFKIINDNK